MNQNTVSPNWGGSQKVQHIWEAGVTTFHPANDTPGCITLRWTFERRPQIGHLNLMPKEGTVGFLDVDR